jgi:hypothetical protein
LDTDEIIEVEIDTSGTIEEVRQWLLIKADKS